MPDATDIVFALASGNGRSAIATMRLSGTGCGLLLAGLCDTLPEPRRASVRRLRSVEGSVLDRAMVLWLPGPASYTGEDGAELHLHGGRAVIEAVSLDLVARGARPAEAGEFTRRAFLNGRIDLLEAEGIADLVEAETQAQRRQALRQLNGELGTLYRGWAARLRRLLAFQEALIDFPEDDLPADGEDELVREHEALHRELLRHLEDGRRGEKIRTGLLIAIIGAPNAGKSSLMNALAGRDVAIVSAGPGTTRDVIEARLEIAGVPVTLADTAGLRETADPVEAEGVRRAELSRQRADLVIELLDAAWPVEHGDAQALKLANKIDLAPAPAGYLGISVHTGAGLDELRRVLHGRIEALLGPGDTPPLTRARPRACLSEAAGQLREGRGAGLPELRAEHLRAAMRALGRVTGAVAVEDVLETIFGSFCIGK